MSPGNSLTDRAEQIRERFAYRKEAADKAAEALSELKPEPEPVAEPAPRAQPEEESEPSTPKKKYIPVMVPETVEGVHNRIQSKRYGSYWSFSKAAGTFSIAGLSLLCGQPLVAAVFAVLTGYLYSQYSNDHKRYRSWSRRVVINPDMSIVDDTSNAIKLESIYEMMDPPDPPTIVD